MSFNFASFAGKEGVTLQVQKSDNADYFKVVGKDQWMLTSHLDGKVQQLATDISEKDGIVTIKFKQGVKLTTDRKDSWLLWANDNESNRTKPA